MKTVDVEQMIAKSNPNICEVCGGAAGKARYICQRCRTKLKMRGGYDVERYFLIRYLLKLVKEKAHEELPD